jgi:hypothetical protein
MPPHLIERLVAQLEANSEAMTAADMNAAVREITHLWSAHTLFELWLNGRLELAWIGSEIVARPVPADASVDDTTTDTHTGRTPDTAGVGLNPPSTQHLTELENTPWPST